MTSTETAAEIEAAVDAIHQALEGRQFTHSLFALLVVLDEAFDHINEQRPPAGAKRAYANLHALVKDFLAAGARSILATADAARSPN